MKRKKIMQINITCGVGSTGYISEALYYATLEKGYDADFAYSAFKPAIKTAFRIETKIQNYIRRAQNKYFGKKQKHSSAGTKRLIKYIKKHKPDLIHVHNVQQNSVNYQLFFEYLKNSNIPVVFTLHDCWSFTGGCYYFTKKNCNLYQSGCEKCLNKNSLDDLTITSTKALSIKKELIGGNNNLYPVCVSNWLCEVAKKSYMGNMQHLPRTIYNGIDTKTFYPRKVDRLKKYGIEDGTFVVLGVASFWDERKGLSLFTKLINKIEFPIKIILIGGNLESIMHLNDSRFMCIDRTENRNELTEIYSMADVFINTSLEETFGLTTAEALACGTPAIVFNSTACPEIVDEKTGIVVSYDIDALVDAVCKIKEKGKACYSKKCRERVVNLFTKERMVSDYLELYEDVLSGKSSFGK